jgi:hypothetical protein
VAARRAAWRQAQPELVGRLIFLDETGARTDMTRRHAWAAVGTRARGRAPGGHWKTTTFLAGLTRQGLIAPFVLDGAMNQAIFTEYVRQMLAPKLEPGDLVILDNLPGHKGEEAAELIRARAPVCCSCRPTAPTSTRSSWHSPSSRRSCARAPDEPARRSGEPSATCSTHSRQPNAPTTFAMRDTLQADRKTL